jgi:hypothetical protein
LSQGRHSAGRAAGPRRTTTGVRKAPAGARKALPEARRASPTRVGAARVAGRRVAEGNGRPAVVTMLGSSEKLFAVLPLAILSVGSVAGLSAITDGDGATLPFPTKPQKAAGSVAHKPAPRPVHAREILTSAPTTIPEAASQVVSHAGLVPGTVYGQRGSTAGQAGSPAETRPATDGSAAEGGTTPAPTASATSTTDPTGSGSLTEAEATARCVASGISTADVDSLGTCVEDPPG